MVAPSRRAACLDFLRWALPRLRLDAQGYRRVWRIACKRLARRAAELGLADLESYRRHLEDHADEWARVDAACRIPVSRFYRDPEVFEYLTTEALPRLAREAATATLRCWSAGCAAGEEAYSLVLAWWSSAAARRAGIEVLGSDADPVLLERARRGCYRDSSLHELPAALRDAALTARGAEWCVRDELRAHVRFERRDLRASLPAGPFELVLCRNVVLTYFAPALQAEVLAAMLRRLRPGGYFVVGAGEDVPAGCGLERLRPQVYRLRDGGGAHRGER